MHYRDEAPDFWVNPKSTEQAKEAVTKLKEEMSNGANLTTYRLVQVTNGLKGGHHRKLEYNSRLAHYPRIASTNAAERCGDESLLSRFVKFFCVTRGVPYLMRSELYGPGAADCLERLNIERSLMLVLTKAQAEGIIPVPSLKPFNQFARAILPMLAASPYHDLGQTITPYDRQYSFLEQMYTHLVNRMAIQKVFTGDAAIRAAGPFSISQVELCGKLMESTGDLQCAIFAIGIHSHNFRSPSELCVQRRIFKILADANLINPGDGRCQIQEPFNDNLMIVSSRDADYLTELNGCYIPVFKATVPKFAKPSQIISAVAARLQTTTKQYAMNDEQLEKRIELLLNGRRGRAPLKIEHHETLNEILVCALGDWVQEYANKKWTYPAMVLKALKECKAPTGRYLVPMPLSFERVKAGADAELKRMLREVPPYEPQSNVPGGWCEDDAYFHSLCDYVDVGEVKAADYPNAAVQALLAREPGRRQQS